MEIKSALRWNKTSLGVIVGTLLPILAAGIILLIVSLRLAENVYLLTYITEDGVLPRILSLATLSNLVPFLLSVYTDRYLSGRGILGATIVWAIVTVALRLLL